MFSALLAQLIPYLIAALVFIAGIFGYGIKKKSEGKQEAENNAALDNAKAAKEAKKAHEENLNSDVDDIANGL